MGSIKDAKKAPVENIDNVMDTLAASMAAKKVIQCNAMITPAIENLIRDSFLIFSFILLNLIKINIKIAAITMRNQTNGIAVMDISFPKMAVKPAINTNTWRCR